MDSGMIIIIDGEEFEFSRFTLPQINKLIDRLGADNFSDVYQRLCKYDTRVITAAIQIAGDFTKDIDFVNSIRDVAAELIKCLNISLYGAEDPPFDTERPEQ